MTTTICFVRHGNTNWNQTRRSQGQQHNELSERGHEQAAIVAKRLAEENEAWDAFYVSDLLRARQTGWAISKELDLPITEFDERLRERGQGRFESTLLEERVERWGENWRELTKKKEYGVEPLEDMIERGLNFINDILEKHKGQKVLVVSHGLFMKHVIRAVTKDESVDKFENTSLTTIQGNQDGFECVLNNCSKHLPVELTEEGNLPPEVITD